MPGTALAVAHRAGNCLNGLQVADAAGADIIEADIRPFQGRLEVRHARTLGPLPWLWDGWEVKSAGAPRLSLGAMLEAAPAGSTFMLDLKGRQVAQAAAVAEELRRRAPQRPVVVCTRNWPVLAAFDFVPWVRTVRSARHSIEFRRLLCDLRTDPGYGVSVHRTLLNPRIVETLHRSVDVVMTWPVNEPADLEQVLTYRATGDVGVITDSTEVVRSVAQLRRARVPN